MPTAMLDISAMNPHTREVPRVLGEHVGRGDDRMMVLLAGMHGNEWAGIHAVHRVLDHLRAVGARSLGRVVAIAGNLQALKRRLRYIDQDLNRMWTDERVAAIRTQSLDEPETAEHREMRELLDTLDDVLEGAPKNTVMIDLHTSSADGEPFGILRDSPGNRRLARHLPMATLGGLERYLKGVLFDHLSSRGHASLGIEGGQHDADSSIDHLEAAVWLALVSEGFVKSGDAPFLDEKHSRLHARTRHLPRAMELSHRHHIKPGDEFKMRPGFRHFQWIPAGTELADDRHGIVTCPHDGWMIMPLYQGKGEDGFFLAQEVR